MAACGACPATRSKDRHPCRTSGETRRLLKKYFETLELQGSRMSPT